MSSATEDTVLVSDLPQVSPQSQAYGPLEAAAKGATPSAASPREPQPANNGGREVSRSVSPDLQHPDEFRPPHPLPAESQNPAPASSPLPVPGAQSVSLSDSSPYLSIPRSGRRGEPILTDFRPKPASYENTELVGRLATQQGSHSSLDYRDMEMNGRSFHEMDPAEIDFDTKMAYQSLGELSPPNKYEEVPPSGNSIYNTPRPLHKCQGACNHKHSSAVPVVLCSLALLVLLALLLATAGLSLAIYNFTEIPESTSSDIDNLEVQLQTSQAMILTLNDMVDNLRQELARVSDTNQERVNALSLSLNASTEAVDEVGEEIDNVTSLVGNILDPNRSTRFQDLRLYQNCTSSKLTECTINTGLRESPPSFGSCETGLVTMNPDGQHNSDIHCAVTATGNEENPIITTLDVDESSGRARCLCYIIGFSSNVNLVTCAMFATRCPQSYLLDTLLKLT